MSSISPIQTKEFARRINGLGCEYLDAPVSGGEVGAKAASLTIMVGGTDGAFAKVKPLFERMGKNITLVGGNGDGQTTKVANQIIVALTIEAVGEALLFASKAGADPAKVRQALMGGFASSRILEVHGERMVKRTFDPGFRIALHQKDLNLALSAARADGREPAEYRDGAGAVQRMRGAWRRRVGPLGDGPRARDAGEFRGRAARVGERAVAGVKEKGAAFAALFQKRTDSENPQRHETCIATQNFDGFVNMRELDAAVPSAAAFALAVAITVPMSR